MYLFSVEVRISKKRSAGTSKRHLRGEKVNQSKFKFRKVDNCISLFRSTLMPNYLQIITTQLFITNYHWQRNRDGYVDSNLADIDLLSELASCRATIGEDGRAVAVPVGINQLEHEMNKHFIKLIKKLKYKYVPLNQNNCKSV